MTSCRSFCVRVKIYSPSLGTGDRKMPKSIPAMPAFGGHFSILPAGGKARGVNDLATI